MITKPTYSISTPLENHLNRLQKLWTEAFRDTPDLIQMFFDTAYSSARCLIASSKDEVLAALYWFDCEYQGQKLAYLYAVATAKKYRGMGICHKLMEQCHIHLSASDYAGVLLVPRTKALYSFYASLGYKICSHIKEFHCTAEEGNITLLPINRQQYASLRRSFLPKNAVIQEGENLAFLQTYAQFYVGCNNFLLAAYQEKSILHGIELLGNSDAASTIVSSLGCNKGIFRIPVTSCIPNHYGTTITSHNSNDNIPFAMYHPLNNTCIYSPLYFGLAFD